MVLAANPDQEDFPPLPPDQDQPFFEPPKLPPKDPDSIIYYRGNRIYMKDDVMEVAKTNILRLDDDTIALEITFTQSLNPRSVNEGSFIIDDEPLPDGTRIIFNRRGDTVRIILQMEDDYFSLSIQNVSSFNGKLVEPVDFDMTIPLPESPEEDSDDEDAMNPDSVAAEPEDDVDSEQNLESD